MQVRSEGWHRPLLDDGRINFTYVLIMEVAEGFCVTEMVSPCSPVGLHGGLDSIAIAGYRSLKRGSILQDFLSE